MKLIHSTTLAVLSAAAFALPASAGPVNLNAQTISKPNAIETVAYCVRRTRVVVAPAPAPRAMVTEQYTYAAPAYGYGGYGGYGYAAPAYPYGAYGYAPPGGVVGAGLDVLGTGANVIGGTLFGTHPYQGYGW